MLPVSTLQPYQYVMVMNKEYETAMQRESVLQPSPPAQGDCVTGFQAVEAFGQKIHLPQNAYCSNGMHVSSESQIRAHCSAGASACSLYARQLGHRQH